MAHSATTLSEFQDGETRLIYARPRIGGDLWLLPDDSAKENRKFTKADLRCPVDSCEQPDLTTVARKLGSRDGFRHFGRGGGHSPESLFHLQGKARILTWVAERHPRSTVRAEESSNAARERIADVMVTAVSGQRIAIEIQYAALTPDAWQERHDSYAAQGIIDVWLFGHYGNQLRAAHATYGEGMVKLNPTHERVVAADMPLLWFNPITADIGTAVTGAGMRTVPATTNRGRFERQPLTDFALLASGFLSPRIRWLADNAVRVAKADAAAAAAAAERVEAGRRADLERKTRAALQAAADQRIWEASAERAGLVRWFDGTLPTWLRQTKTSLAWPAEQWQSRLFFEFIHDSKEDDWVRRDFAAASLRAELGATRIPEKEMQATIKQWFEVMVDHGFLYRRTARLSYGKTATKYLTVNMVAEAIRRTERAARVARMAQSGYRSSEPEIVQRSAEPPRTPPPTGFDCTVCHLPLHPVLADVGTHPNCHSRRSIFIGAYARRP